MNLKTKEELLAKFMKSNKVRRMVLANRAGFDSAKAYKEHLQNGIKKDDSENSKVTIHNVHILDNSGSMGGMDYNNTKASNAKKGIKQEWEELSKDSNVDYTHTLVVFGSGVDVRGWKLDLADLNKQGFGRQSGMTALYQAIGETLSKLIIENNESDRVLVKIFTDGGENGSYGTFRYAEAVQDKIRIAQELGITITFVGTDRDVMNIKTRLGIDATNTLVHDNTPQAVMDSFNLSTISTKTYAANVSRGATKEETLTGFYKQQETL